MVAGDDQIELDIIKWMEEKEMAENIQKRESLKKFQKTKNNFILPKYKKRE